RRGVATAAQCVVLGVVLTPLAAHAAILQASDGASNDNFGSTVGQSGSTALVGAYFARVNDHPVQGTAYVFRNTDTATGPVTENVKLLASDGAASTLFGFSVSQSGNTGLVGADNTTVGANTGQGAAYVFRNLDTATGTVTQNLKLVASDGAASDFFGFAVSLSGSIGLVGAYNATAVTHEGGFNAGPGAAYVFRNLDTITSTDPATNPVTISQSVKLTASDGAAGDIFGRAVSQSGSTALVGAANAGVAGHVQQGAAYVFRNMDTATGTVTQNVKLIASDGAANDFFGLSVSLAGSTGLVGAYSATVAGNAGRGAAYLFRNLNTVTSTDPATNPLTVTEDVKLIASDGAANAFFGVAVSQSGNTGLVGASNATVAGQLGRGAAYLFFNLDTAAGTVSENVKLTASDGAPSELFGKAVALDGDHFSIGSQGATSSAAFAGKAYSGTISSMTTLDAGSASRVISGISFVSQDDWVVGKTTIANQVTLSKGDTANVTASGRGVYVGQNSGSSNNRLLAQGTVTAGAITVSAASGATDNTLEIASNGTTTAGTVTAYNGITVNPDGKVLLSGTSASSDRIGNSTPLKLAGGTLDLGGLSEGAAGTTGMGLLYVTAASTIDFGTTSGSNAVQFAGIGGHTVGQVLHITNWEPSGGATDQLFFSGVANQFVLAFAFADVSFNGTPGYHTTQFSGFYEVSGGGNSPAPEPSTMLLGGLTAAGLGMIRRRGSQPGVLTHPA
ncbi:MAG: hypothetical protein JWM57_1476, partial [Phycisphaerales bacterium]|nr:hypothetical protein [Phycisphaerales bacterium]